MSKHPCGICSKGVKTGGILCTNCNKWIHLNCMNLAYSVVKTLSEDELKTWKCSTCSLNITETVNCSSLAQEIDCALLKENENLRQELYEVKNKSSFFELQLEDDLKQKEEELETKKRVHEEREKELEEKIKSLEIQLKREKEINEAMIAQEEEEKQILKIQNSVSTANAHCNECTIRREETKNMLSSIRSLETVILILRKENKELQQSTENSKSNCITCFPPLTRTKKFNLNTNSKHVPNWQEVRDRNSKLSKTKILTSTPAITVQNRFELFSDCTSDEDEIIDEDEEYTNPVNLFNTKHNRQNKVIDSPGKQENEIVTEEWSKKSKILLCTDSHGRELSFHLNNMTNKFDAVGFVKPGGCAKQILIEDNIEGEHLKADDVLVIMAGSNDVARNEAQSALNKISNIVNKYQKKHIILVDLPIRHDLVRWSCVNLEVKKTNSALKELSEQYSNVTLVEASLAERNLHTRHGQHLNKRGKHWLANKICTVAVKTTLERDRDHSSEDKKRIPEAMTHAAAEVSLEDTSPTTGVTTEQDGISTLQGNDAQLTTPAILA